MVEPDVIARTVEEISRKYQKSRKSRKMTQEEVLEAAGISRSSLARFESGKHNPTLECLIKMTDAMGYRFDVKLTRK